MKLFAGPEPILKFCYNPTTGEFLCGPSTSFHREIIKAHGQGLFNDYVRGIYFQAKKIIYLRHHERGGWLILTQRFLRERGTKKNIKIAWGKIAAQSLSRELRGL